MAILWGTTTGTHGSSPGPAWDPMSEESVDSTNTPPHTLGIKWGLVRIYNDNGYGPSFPIADSGATHHAAGRALVLSVGKQYYASACLPSTTGNPINKASEAQWDAFFDGLLGFGANALSYSGGAAQKVYLIIQHEFDNSNNRPKWGTATDYIAYYRRVRARYAAALTRHSITAGSSGDRVKFGWVPTQYGMTGYTTNGSSLATPYWPEDATHTGLVDFVGSDAYNTSGWNITGGGGSFTASKWRSFAQMYADTEQFASDKGKSILHGEVDTVEFSWDPVAYPNPSSSPSWQATGAQSGSQWFTDAAAHMLANGRYLGLCLFVGGELQAGTNYRYDWGTGLTAKHEALRQAILSTQGTPSQALPSKASITSGPTSSTDGTSVTVGWAAPPSGDNVTGWRAWIAPATGSFTGYTSLGASARSVTFPTTPGTAYKIEIEAVNAAGPSGYYSPASLITTASSGGNQAPTISSLAVAPSASGLPNQVDVTAAWSDPNGDACTLVFTDSSGGSYTQGPTVFSPVTQTITLPKTGTYNVHVVVTDPGGLSSSADTTAAVDLGDAATSNFGWPRLVAGTPIAQLTSRVRQFQDAADQTVYSLSQKVPTQPHNLLLGLTASNFETASIGGSQTQTLTGGTLTAHKMQVQGDGTINNVVFMLATLQSGTGSSIAIFSADGTKQLGVGTGVDAALTAGLGWTSVPCPVDSSLVNPGDLIYVVFVVPSGITTAPQIRGSAAGVAGYNGGLTAAQGLRSGFLSSVSSMPSTLNLAGMSQAGAGWCGVTP